MANVADLVQLEERGWEALASREGAAFYDTLMTEDARMMFAGIGEYVLQMLLHSAYFFVVWPAAGLIGGVISILYGRKISSGSYVPNFTDRVISYTWSGFVITLVIMIVSLVIHEMNPGSFVMVLTGFPTFVTGMILRFRPLIAGGIVFWTIGVISFFYLPELRSLLFSLSIVLGYLAPGYLLRTAERRARNNTAQ